MGLLEGSLFSGQLVIQSATLSLRNLVVWVRTSDLVRPLHFVSLDHERADLWLSINSRQEGNNEVSTIFAIRFKLSLLGLDAEFGC